MKSDDLFGEIAIKKGYIKEEDVKKALKIQKELNKKGKHKLIGLIMLELGLLDSYQLLDILKYIEERKKDKEFQN